MKTKQTGKEPRKVLLAGREQRSGGPNQPTKQTKPDGRTEFPKEGNAQKYVRHKSPLRDDGGGKETGEAGSPLGDNKGREAEKGEDHQRLGASMGDEEWKKVQRKKH
jgi:hypothetical protein